MNKWKSILTFFRAQIDYSKLHLGVCYNTFFMSSFIALTFAKLIHIICINRWKIICKVTSSLPFPIRLKSPCSASLIDHLLNIYPVSYNALKVVLPLQYMTNNDYGWTNGFGSPVFCYYTFCFAVYSMYKHCKYSVLKKNRIFEDGAKWYSMMLFWM